MLYYTIFVAITVLTAVSHGKPAAFRSNQPKPCCLPDQFTATVGSTVGSQVPNVGESAVAALFNFSFDAKRQMAGMKGASYSIAEKRQTNIWIIESAVDKQVYTIDLDTKKCTKSSFAIDPFSCIPDAAVYLYSSNFGHGSSQFKTNTWFVEQNDSVSIVTVTDDGLCVPVTGHTFSSNPSALSSLVFTDVVLQINDPTIFDIPAECNDVV